MQNPNSCSYLKFIYFRVEILYRWLGWSNFKILSFGKAHMVRKDPNFWYLMKKSSCQKSVQKKCKSAGALSLKWLGVRKLTNPESEIQTRIWFQWPRGCLRVHPDWKWWSVRLWSSNQPSYQAKRLIWQYLCFLTR